MEPHNPPEFLVGQGPWALIAFLALFVLLLPFLQRRLRIFSRGTVAFIVSALMIFTVVDGINVLNGIRNSESRIRREARENAVTNLYRTWIQEGSAAALAQLPSGVVETSVDAVQLQAFEATIEGELGRLGSPAKRFNDLKLVSIEVQRTGMWGNWGDYEHWNVEILVDDGARFHILAGDVRVLKHEHATVRIDDIDAYLRSSMSHDDNYAANLFQPFELSQRELRPARPAARHASRRRRALIPLSEQSALAARRARSPDARSPGVRLRGSPARRSAPERGWRRG